MSLQPGKCLGRGLEAGHVATSVLDTMTPWCQLSSPGEMLAPGSPLAMG